MARLSLLLLLVALTLATISFPGATANLISDLCEKTSSKRFCHKMLDTVPADKQEDLCYFVKFIFAKTKKVASDGKKVSSNAVSQYTSTGDLVADTYTKSCFDGCKEAYQDAVNFMVMLEKSLSADKYSKAGTYIDFAAVAGQKCILGCTNTVGTYKNTLYKISHKYTRLSSIVSVMLKEQTSSQATAA